MTVSIITVVKNHEKGLRTTLESILEQTFTDWELIIVVGDSNDLTAEIAQHASLDTRVSVIWQKSKGIYPAMNLGIQNAKGEYVVFMNAGDIFYLPDTLKRFINIARECNVGVVIGGYRLDDYEKREYVFRKLRLSPLRFAFTRRGGCHQSMIYNLAQVKALGGYNCEYLLSSDYDLTLKVIGVSGGLRYPEVMASVEPGGISHRQIFSVHKEKARIRKIYFKSPAILVLSYIWNAFVFSKLHFNAINSVCKKWIDQFKNSH